MLLESREFFSPLCEQTTGPVLQIYEHLPIDLVPNGRQHDLCRTNGIPSRY